MRALADPVEEIDQHQDVKKSLVPTIFNGRTRITGRHVDRPWEAYVPGLEDHVLVALRGGPGPTFYRMDGKSHTVPVHAGLISVIPRGRDALWRGVGGPVSNVFLGHERLLSCAEQISDGRPTELLLRVSFDDPRLYAILELLSGEAELGSDSSRLFIEQLLDVACIHLLRAHSVFCLPEPGRRRGLASWQVKRITAYVRARLDQDISLQELADVVHLSRFYFCSAFRMATGCTPHEWVTRLRIDEARRLLAIGSMPVTEVALTVGYQTPSAFACAFRRHLGVSPREYRRRL